MSDLFSKVLGGINTGLSAIGGAYDVFSGERNRRDYKQQQNWQNSFMQSQQAFGNDYLRNQMQYRAKDFDSAGLHKSLLAGSSPGPVASTPVAPGGGSAGQPRTRDVSASSLMEMSIAGAQRDQIRANTSLTRAEEQRVLNNIGIDTSRLEIDKSRLGLDTNRDSRESEMQPLRVIAQQISNELQNANISKVKADTIAQELANKYVSEHNMRMPTRDALTQEIDKMLGGSSPMAVPLTLATNILPMLALKPLASAASRILTPTARKGASYAKSAYNLPKNLIAWQKHLNFTRKNYPKMSRKEQVDLARKTWRQTNPNTK